MNKSRRIASGILIILGILVFSSLLLFFRDAKLEWAGVGLVFLGVIVGYHRSACPVCSKMFTGVAVKQPPFCPYCGTAVKGDSSETESVSSRAE